MISHRIEIRRNSFCLILAAVLFLGLVQWSFLPLLIDSGLPSSSSVVAVSSGHTSKFAAPFKCLFGDTLNVCVLPSSVTVPRVTASLLHRYNEPASNCSQHFFSDRQLRAPPCV